MTDDASIERFFGASESAVGVADVIVNNAGASRFHWLEQTDTRWLRSEIETNLIGPMVVTHRALAPLLTAGTDADVVMVSSDAARRPRPASLPTAPPRRASNYSEALSLALEGTGIRVVKVRLGPALSEFSFAWDLTPETMREADGALGVVRPPRRAHDDPGQPGHPDAGRRRACDRSRRDAAAPRARRHDRAPALRTAAMTDLYYDPYDFEIDANPHPVWRRMRDEAPLYRNDTYEFWALSRYEDVVVGLTDWKTYSSARGTLLELIRHNVEFPPGMIIFEDPPLHAAHRALLARMFTPRRIAQIEPQVRAYCASSLDPLVGDGHVDFIADLGSQMPMRVIGMLLGIPEQDQEELRDAIDAGLSLEQGESSSAAFQGERVPVDQTSHFSKYIEWRRKHPSDDLMTELLNARFADDNGIERTLRDDELLGYIGLLAAPGNETTTRLIGWTAYLLDRFPEQRRLLAEDRGLVPNAIEEILRYEAPSPVQARYVTRDVELHGTWVPEGSTLLLLNGSANRDEREFEDADRLDVRRRDVHHLSFGHGIHFCLGASLARLRGPYRPRRDTGALDRVGNRSRRGRDGAHVDGARLEETAGPDGAASIASCSSRRTALRSRSRTPPRSSCRARSRSTDSTAQIASPALSADLRAEFAAMGLVRARAAGSRRRERPLRGRARALLP